MSASPDRQLELPPQYSVNDIFDLNDRIGAYFASELATPAAMQARAHLQETRGYPDWVVSGAGLGYVRPSKAVVLDWARANNVPLELCAEAGVVKRSARHAARLFERKHRRAPASDRELSEFFLAELANKPEAYSDFPILVKEAPDGAPDARPEYCYGDFVTIPIHVEDDAGRARIGGFQFRSMRGDIDKNDRYRSPLNTRAMTWNRTLIGLAEERAVMAASRRAVLCEGRFDQLSARGAVHDWPIETRPGTFALGGISVRGVGQDDGTTARERAGVLGLIEADEIFLLLDTDDRGTDAILALGPVLRGLGAQVYIVRLADVWDERAQGRPVPKDASELYASPNGPALLAQAIEASRSRPLATYATDCLDQSLAGMTHAGQIWHRLRALDRMGPILAALPDTERTACVSRVATALSFPDHVVALAINPPETTVAAGPRGRSL
jgi:hypothetical protein